jgi:hypothetical protein
MREVMDCGSHSRIAGAKNNKRDLDEIDDFEIALMVTDPKTTNSSLSLLGLAIVKPADTCATVTALCFNVALLILTLRLAMGNF